MTTVDTIVTMPPRSLVFNAQSRVETNSLWGNISRKLSDMPRYDDDPVWEALFARSQDVLVRLGEEALAEARAGRTELLDPESL